MDHISSKHGRQLQEHIADLENVCVWERESQCGETECVFSSMHVCGRNWRKDFQCQYKKECVCDRDKSRLRVCVYVLQDESPRIDPYRNTSDTQQALNRTVKLD